MQLHISSTFTTEVIKGDLQVQKYLQTLRSVIVFSFHTLFKWHDTVIATIAWWRKWCKKTQILLQFELTIKYFVFFFDSTRIFQSISFSCDLSKTLW